jgi:hypothetical protein
LADFDHEAIKQYNVIARDIENAYRYVAILQGADSRTYTDITAGCYYGTSALLHEVIEVRILLERDPWLLRRPRQRVKKFLQDNDNAHVEALKVEYPYLQQKIAEILGERVGIGELVKAKWYSVDIAYCRPKTSKENGQMQEQSTRELTMTPPWLPSLLPGLVM